MGRQTALLCGLVGLVLVGGSAFGHFHTIVPDSPNGYAVPGGEVACRYFWGHPYEMILFDAREPVVYAVAPSGAREKVAVRPTQTKDEETGELRKTFSLSYTPEEIGDTWLVLEAPPYPIEEEGEAVQDCVKQCVHVLAEDGWDARLGLPIELVPLTRPYGLEPGFAFTVRAYLDGKPLADAACEIEKFNGFHVTAEMLPRDQFGNEDVPMITRVAKTDANGYMTCTLDEPGWWVIAVMAESGEVSVAGKAYPRVLRGCLWVHVDEAFTVGE